MRVAIVAVFFATCGTNGSLPPITVRDDPCGSGAPTSAGRAALHRTPFLQDAGVTAVTVAWAGLPDSTPAVAIAREDDEKRETIATFPGAHPAPEREREQRSGLYEEVYEDYDEEDRDVDEDVDEHEPLEAEDFYELAARVSGLEPGVRYCYRLRNSRGALTEWASLGTAPKPEPGRVDRFLLLGDSGSGLPSQHAVAMRIARVPVDAILFLGDIAYRSGTAGQLQKRFFDVYGPLIQRVPVYAAIGNHDNRTHQGRAFEEAFILPGNERWYSFNLGDVHFVVLDTTRIGPEQAEWLDADLAHDKQRFTVVIGHHPPFTSASRGGSAGFVKWFVPVLTRHEVELVITGHDHVYERRKPVGGTVYIISGGGGQKLHRSVPQPGTARYVLAHHYLVLEAHADYLRLRAIDVADNVIDDIKIDSRR
jgi:3',5'-cyclic AMP phosphodiesterase CpdA